MHGSERVGLVGGGGLPSSANLRTSGVPCVCRPDHMTAGIGRDGRIDGQRVAVADARCELAAADS
jgi:hypothetical protein